VYAGNSINSNSKADGSSISDHPPAVKLRPYVCTVCDKRFITKTHMTAHISRHTGQKYSCTLCEKCFASQSTLSQHKNIHTGKYKCTECGECWQSSTHLARHRRSHSGEKPFECSVCSKRFTRAGNLVVHSRIHSGKKPYKCHMCVKAFSHSGNLNTHMSVHTGDKPYKCSLCNKSFSHSSNLQKHKHRAHSNRDHITVLTVWRCLRQKMIWSIMFVFTLVKSRTHVDTVQNVLHHITNSRHICWSHTMTVLGWHVTFVRRSSAAVITLTLMYVDIMVWSHMFAVTVQCVSVQQVNWNVISRNTRNISSLAVVYVVNVSDIKVALKVTSSNVVMISDSTMFNCLVCVCVTWLSSASTWHSAVTHGGLCCCSYLENSRKLLSVPLV